MGDTIGYLADEVSKQIIEGMVWILLAAYSQMQKETHELKNSYTKSNGNSTNWKTTGSSVLKRVRMLVLRGRPRV